MSKHTPGPWVTDEVDHDAPYENIKIKAGNHHTVCTVWIDDAPVHDFNAMQYANARLIAAAPELLEALKLCASVCAGHTMHKDGLVKALEAARAAIAKATGEQQP